jgi:hypothetical protein
MVWSACPFDLLRCTTLKRGWTETDTGHQRATGQDQLSVGASGLFHQCLRSIVPSRCAEARDLMERVYQLNIVGRPV